MLVPVAIVGQALAAAALPFMARLWSEGRREELDALVLRTLRAGVAIAVFAAGALFALAGPAVTAVYERGRFSAEDTLAVATLLSILIFACPAWVAQQIASRAFYARGDTWRPMLLGTAVSLGAIPLYLVLGPRLGAPGLAWAGVLAMSANALATLALAQRLHGTPALASLAASGLRAAGISGIAALAGAALLRGGEGTLAALLDLGIGGAAYGAVALALVFVLGDAPLRTTVRRLAQRLGRRAPGVA
jgi:putative peptidoglycan lipid II flippase